VVVLAEAGCFLCRPRFALMDFSVSGRDLPIGRRRVLVIKVIASLTAGSVRSLDGEK